MHLWRYFQFLATAAMGLYLLGGGASRVDGAEETYSGCKGYWATVCATAYSPSDPIDDAYRATKGKWLYRTADGRTDVREDPYGVAVPLRDGRPALRFGTQIIIPKDTGYVARTISDRTFEVDDVGNGRQYFPYKRGCLHIDLRFKSHESAIAWAGPRGYRFIRIFVVTGPAPIVPPVYTESDFRIAAR